MCCSWCDERAANIMRKRDRETLSRILDQLDESELLAVENYIFYQVMLRRGLADPPVPPGLEDSLRSLSDSPISVEASPQIEDEEGQRSLDEQQKSQ